MYQQGANVGWVWLHDIKPVSHPIAGESPRGGEVLYFSNPDRQHLVSDMATYRKNNRQ